MQWAGIPKIHLSLFKPTRTIPQDGRKAYDTACKECRLAMDEATIFCGRFKLGEQLHRSATCVVYLALDVRNDGALVVVKLMLNRDQYEREVRWEVV